MAFAFSDRVRIEQSAGGIAVSPSDESKEARAEWGMTRTQIANLVQGVTKGFERRLEITGVGYRAAAQGQKLNLALGFSHDVSYQIPAGITVQTPKPTEIVISGIDRQRVGQVAAEIRGFRPPEPYKGKGVKYAGEKIFRKEGKKK
jgi:large subunit ribosomal protein L6